MTYRITLSSNPRIIIVLLLVVLLPAAGIVSFLFLPALLSVVILAVGGYIAYHLVKFLRSSMRSTVETGEEDIRFQIGQNDTTTIPWTEITFAGVCTKPRSRSVLYVYRERDDQLLTVPDEYESFENLLADVREKTSFEEIDLDADTSLNEHLKKKLEAGT